MRIFYYNYKKREVHKEETVTTKAVLNERGYVGEIRETMDNTLLYIQLILPHQLHPDKCTVNFIAFNTLKKQVKKLKISFESAWTDDGIDFIIHNNFLHFTFSYIMMMMEDKIIVISTATGIFYSF